METVFDIWAVPSGAKGGVVTIGNFDGVHLGHQEVLRHALAQAEQHNLPANVLTLEPHPRQFFDPKMPPFRLTPPQDKIDVIRRMQFTGYVQLMFDDAFYHITAPDFVKQILVEGLSARHVVVGEGFSFGHRRLGTVDLLKEMGESHGFEVHSVVLKQDEIGVTYSSTRIRQALKEGNPREAAKMLGRPWSITGDVITGNRQGHRLGFATANLVLADYVRPKYGVYAVQCHLGEVPNPIKGIANIGVRPTVGGHRELMEVHMFDFNDNIYGRVLKTDIIEFIRPEHKFLNLDELKAQIRKDIVEAKQILDTDET